MKAAEIIHDIIAQNFRKAGIALQIKTPSVADAVIMDVLGHLRLDLQDISGEVDKDFSGVGRLEPVMYPGKKLGADHAFHIPQIAGEGRLGEIIFLCCPCQALFIHDGNDVLQKLRIQVKLRGCLPGGMGTAQVLGRGSRIGILLFIKSDGTKHFFRFLRRNGLVARIR